jgi:hypothetical protein
MKRQTIAALCCLVILFTYGCSSQDNPVNPHYRSELVTKTEKQIGGAPGGTALDSDRTSETTATTMTAATPDNASPEEPEEATGPANVTIRIIGIEPNP